MWTLLPLCATLALPLAVGLACPPGYDDIGLDENLCCMHSTDNMTWTMAYTTCLSSTNGAGSLLAVSDANSYYPQYYEVLTHGVNVWTGLLNIAGQYSWADSTPYDASIDPFIAPDAGNETFGYMSGEDGLFRFGDGTTKRGYACWVDLTPAPTTPAPTEPPEACTSAWQEYEGVCYLFSSDQEYWPSAGHACHEQDAELVSIHDWSLLMFLLLTAEPATIYWTGLRNQNQTFVWEDGISTTEVATIMEPYMDGWSEGSDCVALSVGDFPTTFRHMSCLELQNYICYKPTFTEYFFVPEHLDFEH